MSPPPFAVPSVTPAPRLLVWLGFFALAGYAIFLARHASVAAGGSDTSGYLNSARLLAAGKLQDELRVPAEFGPEARLKGHHFMPLGFIATVESPHLPPTYPVGLPLHLALAGKILGWRAGTLAVELASALAALWLCYAIARELGIDPWLAAAGPVVLGVFPVFLFTSIQPLSDTLATAWCLAAGWAALRARRHSGWALACGAALGIAVLVRATNALLAPALVVLLTPGWRKVALAALGGLPAAVWLAHYNHTLYGHALTSGYGAIWAAFETRYGVPTLRHFGYWLAVLLPAVFLGLPFAALWRARSRGLLALGLWFAAIAGAYAFYEMSQQTWWCLRFILPAVPALILAGLLGIQSLPPRGRVMVAAILSAWAVGCSVYWTPRLHPLLMKDYEALYPEACAQAQALFPPNAIIVCYAASGAIYHYTSFPILRWDQIAPPEFSRYAALATASGRPLCAMLWGGFEDEALGRTGAEWSKIDSLKNVTFWRLAAPAAADRK